MLTIQCLTFKLNFESTGTINTAEGGGYESTVTSEITLRFDPDEDKISGEAPLVNEDFEWFAPVCVATGIPGGGSFEVLKLTILTASPNPDALGGAAGWVDATGTEVNLVLSYQPGKTSESATSLVFPTRSQPVLHSKSPLSGLISESWSLQR